MAMNVHPGKDADGTNKRPKQSYISSIGKDPIPYLCQRFGEGFVEYRRLWDSVASTKETLKFPLHLDVELLDACNLKCKMCYRSAAKGEQTAGPVNTGTKMPLETVKRLLTEAAERGARSVSFGAYCEPLLYPRLLEVLEYAKAAGFLDIWIISNGHLLTPEIAEAFIALPITRCYFSIDAVSEETYREIRGNDLSKAVDNILNFLALREARNSILPWTRVSFVDMQENRAEKQRFIEFWESKVDSIDIQKYFPPPQKASLSAKDALGPKQFNCLDPLRRIIVRADGSVMPCCNTWHTEKVCIGNIKDSTLLEIWESKKMRMIQRAIFDDSFAFCAHCQRQ